MSLEQLMDLLQAAADDGTYSRHDIEKVLEKIRKRILDGHAMVDDETESDVENVIVKGGGGFG
jgi:TATA-box binding protein (TBP) (component of TFIID and TFIIIB)